MIRAVREAGLDCHVMVAPVLPLLTDATADLDALLGRIAAAGATSVTVFGLHLRGSTRGWFMGWLTRTRPDLVSEYRKLYGRGAYLPADYRDALRARVAPLLRKHGLDPDTRPFAMRSAPAVRSAGALLQPTLF